MTDEWSVVGGAGFIGTEVRRRLVAPSRRVTVVDVVPPPALPGETFVAADLWEDIPGLEGHVVLSFGQSMPRPVRPWTLLLDNAVTTARLAPALVGHDVTLLSSVEVYGTAPGPLTEDTDPVLPVALHEVERWVDVVMEHALAPVSPHRSIHLCRTLADRDPSGRWVYALSKLAQEMVLRRILGPDQLTVLRLANVVGQAQYRLLGRLVEALLSGRPCVVASVRRSFVSAQDVGRVVAARPGPGTFNASAGTLSIDDVAGLVSRELGLDLRIKALPVSGDESCGDVDARRLSAIMGPWEPVAELVRRTARLQATAPAPLFPRPLAVVIPPRPHRPDQVAERTAAALWRGELRDGRWSRQLTARLAELLDLDAGRKLVLTNSGTNALRLAVWAVSRPEPGDVALCPAYTFHATSEVLAQLGWQVRLVDVDPWTWTLDPDLVAEHLVDPRVRLVVAVDALGNPADYDRLQGACDRAGVPLVADSAPSLGASYAGRPVGTQAASHAFSMSFAKTLTAAGGGGAAVVPESADLAAGPNWLRSASMLEPAAIAAVDQVEVLPELVRRRHLVADVYAELLVQPGFYSQHVRPRDRHALVHWALRVPRRVGRDRLAAALAPEGVSTKSYYQPLSLRTPGPLPVTEALHREVLALPMSSELSVDEAERVAAAVLRSLRRLSGAAVIPEPELAAVR
ncbi:MAG: perosamine synthetase [Nocardioidaceae bacterium]|nr:perosamine synthetase [Nocardioidaceae bacterium]